MRLHSDIITVEDIETAATSAGAAVHAATPHGSRARARAFEVFLTGHGKMGGQYGGTDAPTASWDEWGMVVAALFELDPWMIVGSPGRPIYGDIDAFHEVTANRYVDLRPADACHWHRWDPTGRTWTTSGIEAYGMTCRKCGATVYRPIS